MQVLPAKTKDEKKIAQEDVREDYGIKMGNILQIYVNQTYLKHKSYSL